MNYVYRFYYIFQKLVFFYFINPKVFKQKKIYHKQLKNYKIFFFTKFYKKYLIILNKKYLFSFKLSKLL